MNDVLKPDSVAQQATETKPDWRTKEARAARRAKTATVPSVTCDEQPSFSACIEQAGSTSAAFSLQYAVEPRTANAR